MLTNNATNGGDGSFAHSEISLPRPIRFWLMLLFNVPSVICDFCIIMHIMMNRRRRSALHNHAIFIVILFNLPVQIIDINFHLLFLHYGSVQPPKPIVCLIWWLNDYGFYIGGIMVMAWLAIERHILVFHKQWIANLTGRLFLHYLPMATIVTYILLFYIIVIFFLNCEDTYDYKLPICNASPCYQNYGILGMWEFIFNTTTPILVEGIASILFILRIIWQKQRLRHSVEWRKQRRLTIQLLLMSGLNMSFNLPIYLIPLAHLCGLPPEYGVQPELYFFFLGYFVIFLFPFICLRQYPELRKSLKRKILCMTSQHHHATATVAPTLKKNVLYRT
ncbi:unnamed protein product [Rotaria socialis]|uniref:G-protein coupled receptors family 1 profile domain-containing protein n=3 Tax=Rotaria socialis TaxID=392032 RepID=A0A817UIV2_9BILA|nr:unnamed protein product [Rotaria socialis]CAF3445205.1 unnamed protein product [Rotaria socialis]CAF3445453.1 unnamed protein product [Rotaria socialis]CAF3620552.1 unnamed protein product [Rotaria socialis]CAF4432087.1 unnamed protein product [Rotaria socialis]